MTRRGLLGAVALLTLVGGPAAAQGKSATATYVMRHLHTPAGQADPELTPEGQAAAEALVGWFRGKKLAAIYVSPFKRTQATAAPLAASRGLTVETYDPRDTPALLARVRAEGGPVLVIGHSNTVPEIVAGLGGDRPAPLAHEDFGDVWTVTGGKAVRGRVTT
jgi:phosphohistidine phosphatase SixA